MRTAALLLTILGGVGTVAGLVCTFLVVHGITVARRRQTDAMSDPSYQRKQLPMNAGHSWLQKPEDEWTDIDRLQAQVHQLEVTQMMEDRVSKMLLQPLAETRWATGSAWLLTLGVVASTAGAALALYIA